MIYFVVSLEVMNMAEKEIEIPKPAFACTLTDVKTNNTDVGNSIKSVRVCLPGRKLTGGEKEMVHPIFANAIRYEAVRIHDTPAPSLMGAFQPEDVAITPNGQIYFHEKRYESDFSEAKNKNDRLWFVHEMVHVWQNHLGYNVVANALRLPSYEYTLDEKKRFCDYNMEQQGDIIADYYALAIHKPGLPHLLRCKKYRNDPKTLPLLKLVLSDFLKNPTNKAHLPGAQK
jgi:hypothetical protein